MISVTFPPMQIEMKVLMMMFTAPYVEEQTQEVAPEDVVDSKRS